MSKETFPQDDQTLNFDEATNLTIEEAVQKEADLAAGVTADDTVLDKYIKKNRDKVGEQKFVNKDKVKDLSEVDTSVLDKFIEQQRQEFEMAGLVEGGDPVADSTLSNQDVAAVALEPIPVAPVTDDLSKVAEIETFYGDQFDEARQAKKKRKLVIGSLAALFLATAGLAYGINQLKKTAITSSSTTTTSSQTTSSSRQANQADVQAFDDLYKTFFADEGLTKPKNSEFDHLSTLEEALKKLEGTSDYAAAKTKYDGLAKAIAAIKAVNDKFDSPAIVDGEKVEAQIKAGANFDDLTSTILNTGRANLDTLLQAVMTEAKGLLGSGGGVSGSGTETAAGSQSGQAKDKSEAVAQTAKASEQAQVAASNLQRQVSRVPYNQEVIADTSNSAWTFAPGVLEEILRVSRERGYITGDNYVLEPVNIINGNGYYNMFKPDGTYLFSINAKTGYFVGNGAGHADDLDY